MFMHGGVLHLAVNMFALNAIGADLEARFGPLRLMFIFFMSGMWGQLLSLIFVPSYVCVGASGAVFGLFGAQWADFLQVRKHAFGHVRFRVLLRKMSHKPV